VPCGPTTILCPGGNYRCIYEEWMCDGENNCGDNSDEDPQICEAASGKSLPIS